MGKGVMIVGWILAGIILTVVSSGCVSGKGISGSGVMKTESREISGIKRVSIMGSGQLLITQGDRESLRVEAEDNLLTFLHTAMDGNTLVLEVQPGVVFLPTQPIVYRLTVKELEGLTLAGSGKIEVEKLVVGRLSIVLDGSGEIHLGDLYSSQLLVTIGGSGKCGIDQGITAGGSIEITGSGDLQAGNLAITSARIVISGSGSATVWVKYTLNVQISGSGSVGYYGSPQLTWTLPRSGQVTKLGDK